MIKEIKIGDKIYPVREEQGLNYKEGVQAQIRYREVIIAIEPGQEPQYECDCLVHEAVHGMLVFMGENEKNNEPTVTRIANGLLMIIRDNPNLMKRVLAQYSNENIEKVDDQ